MAQWQKITRAINCLLRDLRRLMTEVQLRVEKFDAVLELTVLGGVDERIDTAVGKHHRRR